MIKTSRKNVCGGHALGIAFGITMVVLLIAGSVSASPYAYISNAASNNVSVIDTATNAVTASVNVGLSPYGVAVNTKGTRVYVTNYNGNSISVIDTATNTVTATVPVGSNPYGIAVNPEGTRVYVTNNFNGNSVSVIDTATNTVTATVPVGSYPYGVAVNPKGTRVYVANGVSNSVSIIDTATNTVTATVPVGSYPYGVAVNPDGARVYVTNLLSGSVSIIETATNAVTAVPTGGWCPKGIAVNANGTQIYVANGCSNSVSIIDTATNTVTATVPVGSNPMGVAVNPEGTRVYVVNDGSESVSVIDTATNAITATVSVGRWPVAFGQFIGPDISPEDRTPPAISGAATTSPNSNGWYNTNVIVQFTASDAISGIDTVTPDTTISTEGASQSVTGTATDKAGNSASFTVSGINIDKTPPTITGSRTPAPNAYGWNNVDVAVHFDCSDSLSGIESCTPDSMASTEGTGQSVSGTAVDRAGNSASATVSGINIDKTPPIITGAAITSSNSNGWYNSDVVVHFTVSDAISGIDTVTPDITISTEGSSQSVTGTATDKAGNSASFIVSGINIDKTLPIITINTPAPYGVYPIGTALNFSATDSLSGLAIVSGNLTNTTGAYMEVASGYTPPPGVYTLVVSATDKAGNTAKSSPVYFVVYDSNGGYVTGAGWINSPAGAYSYDTTLTGRADFGFISRYQKGATVPDGVTEFQFRVANLNFHSNTYEWLVVAGARAQYKGTGTINGAGNYGFMLTAIDGAINGGGGSDKFRIKIWDKNNNDAVVYDNGLGASDSTEPTTVVQGGSIVIHAEQ